MGAYGAAYWAGSGSAPSSAAPSTSRPLRRARSSRPSRWLRAACTSRGSSRRSASATAAAAAATWSCISRSNSVSVSGLSGGFMRGNYPKGRNRKPPGDIRHTGGFQGPTARSYSQVLQPGLERGRGLRATQVLERVALDLADPLAGEVELLAHLIQRAGPAIVEAEAHAHDRSGAVRQRPEHRPQAVLQQAEVDHVGGHRGVAVLDELTEGRSAVVADRRLERESLAAVAEDLLDPLAGHVERLAQF